MGFEFARGEAEEVSLSRGLERVRAELRIQRRDGKFHDACRRVVYVWHR